MEREEEKKVREGTARGHGEFTPWAALSVRFGLFVFKREQFWRGVLWGVSEVYHKLDPHKFLTVIRSPAFSTT